MVDPIEITCENCESVFTYNFQDIRRREESSFLGMNVITKRYITCPVCKYDNDINPLTVVKRESEENDTDIEKECEEC